MELIIRKLFLLAIIISTTDIIRFSVLPNLSFFRIAIVLTGLTSIFYTIVNGKIRKGRYLYFILLVFGSSILNYFRSTNKGWASSFLMNDLMGVIIIFVISNFFSKQDTKVLLKALINSQIVTIGLSAYVYLKFMVSSAIDSTIKFGPFIIELSEGFLNRSMISGHPRLALPYSTPPHLSIVMVIIISMLLIEKDLFKKRMVWISFFIWILLFTYSRTGIVALLLTIITLSLMRINKVKIKYNHIIFAGFSAILIIIVSRFMGSFYVLNKLLSRFKMDNILENRHLLVPFEGILLWLSSLKRFVLGIGSGSSINIIGKYTVLPPHFFNSYITLIAERGYLGLLIVFEYVRYYFISLKSLSTRVNTLEKSVIVSFLIILYSFIFYEARQNIFIWIVTGIFIMVNNRRVGTDDQ